MTPKIFAVRPLIAALAALTLAACENQAPAPTEIKGSEPGRPAAEAPQAPPAPSLSASPQADARGVIVYPDYAVIQARPGDSIDAMAARVSVAPSELAAYNGLPASYTPQTGDELVLPPRPGGYGVALAQPGTGGALSGPASGPISEGPTAREEGWDPSAIEQALNDPAPATAPAAAPQSGAPVPTGLGQSGVQHVVAAGETVASIAQLYGATINGIVTWNALSGPEQTLQPGTLLLVPTEARVSQPRGQVAGEGLVAPPPSANDILPKDTTPAPTLASPNLGQYQTEVAPPPQPSEAPVPVRIAETPTATPTPVAVEAPVARKLLRPVQGRVIKGYSRAPGAERNDGVDFEAAPGTPVLAADDGEVALVSRSLGGLGNIILLRHDGQILTVYGRMDAVEVTKGQRVSRGQVIGTVARASQGPSNLHFEVRRGATSVDPAPFL